LFWLFNVVNACRLTACGVRVAAFQGRVDKRKRAASDNETERGGDMLPK